MMLKYSVIFHIRTLTTPFDSPCIVKGKKMVIKLCKINLVWPLWQHDPETTRPACINTHFRRGPLVWCGGDCEATRHIFLAYHIYRKHSTASGVKGPVPQSQQCVSAITTYWSPSEARVLQSLRYVALLYIVSVPPYLLHEPQAHWNY